MRAIKIKSISSPILTAKKTAQKMREGLRPTPSIIGSKSLKRVALIVTSKVKVVKKKE